MKILSEDKKEETIEALKSQPLEVIQYIEREAEMRLKSSVDDIEALKLRTYSLINILILSETAVITLMVGIQNRPLLLRTGGTLLSLAIIIALWGLRKNITVEDYHPLGTEISNFISDLEKDLKPLNEMICEQFPYTEKSIEFNKCILNKLAKNLNRYITMMAISLTALVILAIAILAFPRISFILCGLWSWCCR